MIIISGQVKATQSATTGCEDAVDLFKGQRIESGSVVDEANEAFAIVENVLQKSILFEIGMQVKLSQNLEQEKSTGIEATCQKISAIFVKVVIMLSLLTVTIWIILLATGIVQLESCAVCYVVERGIGVLVASCPCALGLAVPSVVAIVLNLAVRSGILIKNNGIFERIKKAKKIAFDKTGTLFNKIKKIS